ncbi:prepilin-type N-terminal cleavage/methylation domain-containing protein [Synechococcus sp. PCC 7502]|uniref:prepilin-type N-terminal cleavage/methylation domain-containing protein n=1 Tax=Synechococcus sp. PCC 7502 TaxID=1173263 RepID=UPI00029FCA44|nr:prepilin-type N-terminal cleavage/methylation domain-containing protein [Synechococcus sp. PCC 7502]AFY72597.1 prepilin-type N-terminal cleavage/methylation domain-containing protein [Synechococcus sp. PCC 7502]
MLKIILHKLLINGRNNQHRRINGFTLIELLVALIVASIIVGSLLGFLVNILDRDRKEQAKSDAQEEIQSALNYIAEDLSSAVFIYDADGLYQKGADTDYVANQLPHRQVGSQCRPNLSTQYCTPVLVFWKSTTYDVNDADKDKSQPKGGNSSTRRFVNCLPFPSDNPSVCNGSSIPTYSLVVYYLVKNDNSSIGNNGTRLWSDTSRIVRWEMKDGVPWSCKNQSKSDDLGDPTVCPVGDPKYIATKDGDGNIFFPSGFTPSGGGPPISGTPTSGTCPTGRTAPCIDYLVLPDKGFKRFDIVNATGSLSDRMKKWRKSPEVYNFLENPFQVLVDYIDDTPYELAQDDGVVNNSPININIKPNTQGSLSTTASPFVSSSNDNCNDPNTGVGSYSSTGAAIFAQRVPPVFSSTAQFGDIFVNPTGLSGFYACVNANNISARVYIRTNILARLNKSSYSSRQQPSVTNPTAVDLYQSYTPTSNVRVFGRGILNFQ